MRQAAPTPRAHLWSSAQELALTVRANLTNISDLAIKLAIPSIDLLNRRNKLFVGITVFVLQKLPETRTS